MSAESQSGGTISCHIRSKINFMLDFQELPHFQALHFWHNI